MESLKESILPFIRTHREKLLGFIQNFQALEGPTPLERMVKIFIIQQNLPFNMVDYMTRQSRVIKQETSGCESTEARRLAISEWIHQKAADHRSHSMFQQVFCFEKNKDQILPLIEEELGLIPTGTARR